MQKNSDWFLCDERDWLIKQVVHDAICIVKIKQANLQAGNPAKGLISIASKLIVQPNKFIPAINATNALNSVITVFMCLETHLDWTIIQLYFRYMHADKQIHGFQMMNVSAVILLHSASLRIRTSVIINSKIPTCISCCLGDNFTLLKAISKKCFIRIRNRNPRSNDSA